MGGAATGRRYSGQGPRLYAKPEPIEVTERPVPVTVIGTFQLAKAVLLLGVGLVGRVSPESLRSVPVLPSLIYIAAHGRDTHGVLMPVIGIYVAIVGWGLLRLKRWARRSLIASTGLMMAIWAHKFYVDWMAGEALLRNPVERETVWFLLFLDAVVFLYLVVYDDVPRAFAKR